MLLLFVGLGIPGAICCGLLTASFPLAFLGFALVAVGECCSSFAAEKFKATDLNNFLAKPRECITHLIWRLL